MDNVLKLLYEELVSIMNQGKTIEAKNSPVLQFGKQTDNGKRFALDFRYPMAPVQAFAIFLTACNW